MVSTKAFPSGRFDYDLMSKIGVFKIYFAIAFSWMPQDRTNE